MKEKRRDRGSRPKCLIVRFLLCCFGTLASATSAPAQHDTCMGALAGFHISGNNSVLITDTATTDDFDPSTCPGGSGDPLDSSNDRFYKVTPDGIGCDDTNLSFTITPSSPSQDVSIFLFVSDCSSCATSINVFPAGSLEGAVGNPGIGNTWIFGVKSSTGDPFDVEASLFNDPDCQLPVELESFHIDESGLPPANRTAIEGPANSGP